MRSDDALATVLLASRLGHGDVAPLKASEFWALCDRVDSPGSLLGATAADLVEPMGGDTARAGDAAALLGRGTAVAFELERLESSGVTTLTPFDADYPRQLLDRLATAAPPVLHVAGVAALLRAPSLGVVGDDATGRSAGPARALTEAAVAAGLVVVAAEGSAFGRFVADTAHAVDGEVVSVPAGPLSATVLRRPEIRRAIVAGRAAVCTPYGPADHPGPTSALGRSRVLHALAAVTVVVDTGEDTRRGAVDALGWGARVALWNGADADPVDTMLEARGATPVTTLAEALALAGTEIDSRDGPERDAPAPTEPRPTPAPLADPGRRPSPGQGSLFEDPGP